MCVVSNRLYMHVVFILHRNRISNEIMEVSNQVVFTRCFNSLYPHCRLFGAKCCACLGVIAPTEPHFVNGYVYHSACFTCAVCRRNLNAGDFFYMRHDMKLVCKVDYDRSANKGKKNLEKWTKACSIFQFSFTDSCLLILECVKAMPMHISLNPYRG